MLKRVISLFLCIVIVFICLVPPANAASVGSGLSTVGEFFDWIADSILHGGYNTAAFFSSFINDDICFMNPADNKRHEFVPQHTQVGGKTGNFYVCKYCNKTAGEVGEEAYQQQVSDLPATGITSAGGLLWQVSYSDLDLSKSRLGGGYFTSHKEYVFVSSLPYAFEYRENCIVTFSKSLNFNGFDIDFEDWEGPNIYIDFYCKAPLSGSYRRLNHLAFSSSGVRQGGTRKTYEYSYSLSSFSHYSEGSLISCSGESGLGAADYSFVSADVYYPVYEIIPDTAIDTTSGGQYNVNTRPTTITGGNYGIVGDDNQITTVNDNRKIVNEGDNIYYNPATGQTQNITDWSYDYSSRIYNITLDTGDKVSVEYGDENISIVENKVVEGDTIVNNYTIYYMIEGSGDNPDPTPGPTACPHDWQTGSTVDPTCTAPGKTVYTCSKCGETKTEILPALGHDWQVVRTVPTEYDENGNQTQAGYTLYECSRCGNQYKDEDSTGPPGDDVDDGGLLAWLNSLIKHLSDNLSGVVALIKRFFTEIPELFSGFTGFLAAVFPFLPDEIMLLLTFGMAALVIVGVIKAIRR